MFKGGSRTNVLLAWQKKEKDDEKIAPGVAESPQ
jgi:hypothetical protein